MFHVKHNVIIIGSGPAGYTAAIYLGRAGLNPVMVTGALSPGGQLVNTTEVENFPGFPEGILGPDLMDSAFEEALFLTRFGSSVTLIHRRDSFRASQIMVDRAKANPTITLMTNTVVTSITGTSSPTQNTGAPIAIPGLTLKRPAVAPASVSSIAVRNVMTGEESTLDTNAVFVAIGHTPATDFAAGVVDRDDDGYVVVQGASTVRQASLLQAIAWIVLIVKRSAQRAWAAVQRWMRRPILRTDGGGLMVACCSGCCL